MTTDDDHESCIEFPCEFPIKVMGKDSGQMQKVVTDAVARHAPDSPRDRITQRESRTGKYIALTITITATSKAQLDNIYQELTASEHITMAL
jgi:putative lipoic acid-binding regulatory protein